MKDMIQRAALERKTQNGSMSGFVGRVRRFPAVTRQWLTPLFDIVCRVTANNAQHDLR